MKKNLIIDRNNSITKKSTKKACAFLSLISSLKIINSTIDAIIIDVWEKFKGVSSLKTKKKLTVNHIEQIKRKKNSFLYITFFLM